MKALVLPEHHSVWDFCNVCPVDGEDEVLKCWMWRCWICKRFCRSLKLEEIACVCQYKVCVCGFEPQNQTATFVSDTFQLNGRKQQGRVSEEEEATQALRTHPSALFISPSLMATGLGHTHRSRSVSNVYISTYSLLIPSRLLFLFFTFYLTCIFWRRKVQLFWRLKLKVTLACLVLSPKT